ncbi:MAG: homocysteine S-methyltransferase family protein [Elusimicrobiota bacterium]
MIGFLERLRQGPLVADGAMGTMLMERGLKPGECPEAFGLAHPEALGEIARAYLEAGADIIQTNTFGASPLKLASYKLEDKTEEINRKAVEAARRAVAGKAYVSASCGPTGRLLKPVGDADPEEVLAAFKRQMKALLDAGADILCIETMTDLGEASLAVKAAKSLRPDVPVMATMTFDKTSRGFFTMMGVSVKKAVEGLKAAGADIVGSNCGNGIEAMVLIAKEMRTLTDLPLIIQANAGLPRLVGGKTVYPESPEFWAPKAKDLLAAGVSIVGGCCGTTPEHIRAIRDSVSRFRA